MRNRRQLGNASREVVRDAAGVDSLHHYRAKRRGGRTSKPATSVLVADAPGTAVPASEGDFLPPVRPLAAAVGAAVACRHGLIDGELVVQDASGRSSFPALQEILSKNQTDRLVLVVFDLLHSDVFDLGDAPLVERKAILAALLEGGRDGDAPVQLSAHIVGKWSGIFCRGVPAIPRGNCLHERRSTRLPRTNADMAQGENGEC